MIKDSVRYLIFYQYLCLGDFSGIVATSTNFTSPDYSSAVEAVNKLMNTTLSGEFQFLATEEKFTSHTLNLCCPRNSLESTSNTFYTTVASDGRSYSQLYPSKVKWFIHYL